MMTLHDLEARGQSSNLTLAKDLQTTISSKLFFSFQTPRINDKGDIRAF